MDPTTLPLPTTGPDVTLANLQQIISQSPAIQSRADVPQTQPLKPSQEYDGPSAPNGETIMAADPLASSPAPAPKAARGPSVPPPAGFAADMVASAGPATIPVIPSEEIPPAVSNRWIFFTGRSGVGKDWLADRAQATKLDVSMFLNDLIGSQFPSAKPAETGSLLSTIFAWGEGVTSKDYPITPARFLFLQHARNIWPEYGKPGFWLSLIIEEATKASGLVAVTGVSSANAIKTLTAAGFKQWHVMVSPQTYNTRAKRSGADDKLAAHFDGESVKAVSAQREGAKLPVIWNDTAPKPSARLYSVEEWLAEVNGVGAISFE